MGVCRWQFINHWSNVISHLPRNIFSFTIHYLNTLANSINAVKWDITISSTCTFCDQQHTLDHVISGCKTALLESRCNWCHDPILLNIYKTIKLQGFQAFANIEHQLNPSIITGDEQQPDCAIVNSDNLLLLKLTVGFKTNIKKNFVNFVNFVNHKMKRYQELLPKNNLNIGVRTRIAKLLCAIIFVQEYILNNEFFSLYLGMHLWQVFYLFFWIHFMQGCTTTTRHGVKRKRSTKRLKHKGNLFKNNRLLKGVSYLQT